MSNLRLFVRTNISKKNSSNSENSSINASKINKEEYVKSTQE